ncbi:MAG: bifunctional diguanylate cyclase/phosphodiesterase [Pseudoalteromonas spongiae]
MTQPAEEQFLFLNEDDNETPEQYSGFWDVLIVDDEPEVHSVTQLALSGLSFWNKQLRFHHAYSGEEAVKKLTEIPNISVVLLDVVMETDDAGLVTVKRIREELNNSQLRIILRTGQPGYAPEENIIREYDINDYKTKTELTRAKLVTSLVTALRSYQQLCELSEHNTGLEKVLDAAKSINGLEDLTAFASQVIEQIAKLLDGSGDGVIVSAEGGRSAVLGGSAEYKGAVWQGIEQIDNSRALGVLQQTLANKTHQIDEHDSCFFVEDDKSQFAIYLETKEMVHEQQIKLIEIFLQNVSSAFKNVRMLSELRDAAYKDKLTKLPNRNDFINQIGRFYSDSNNDFSLYFIDIADFSSINNGLGQDVGDLLLQAVATRIQEDVIGIRYFARIGADVFAALVESDKVTPESLNHILSLPFHAGEHLLPVNFHLGVCEQQYFYKDGKQTLKSCYIALNLGKKHLRFNYEYYLPEMEEKMAWQLGVLKELRHDFSEHKLAVWYQPQICLATREVIGCEALLRWPNEQGSFISPAIFVPLAEQSGLILPIGQWVLEQACITQKQLLELGFDMRIAVNVSVPQFRDPQFVSKVKDTLADHQINPQKIELEVTESIVMDEPEIVIEALTELKEHGLEIAIDDFGTGFSSLSYLKKLPLNRIKIDRAFVKDIPEDSGAIAELIVSLGKKLGLNTIAEGIENEEQASCLRLMGCEEAQGFMFAKPMPYEELKQFLLAKK